MKTVVLKSVEGRISLGNPLMTKAGMSRGSDCITILIHNVPDEITPMQVVKLYTETIVIAQGVFEFNYEKINVPSGHIVWIDEAQRPHGILSNGIAKVLVFWDNGEESTWYLSGKLSLKENMQQTIDLMHGSGKGLNLLDPVSLSWFKNRQWFIAKCGSETFRYDRHSN
jgi:hypothetical protein